MWLELTLLTVFWCFSSNDQLSWIVIGSLLAFGIFLIVVIFVCRQCGCCGHPRDVGCSSPALSDTRPFNVNVSVIDSQGIDTFQQEHRPPDQSRSAKLPGLPPYAYECVPGDSPQTAPPPYTVKAEPW
ncbi:hypothetical protein KP79_PYT11432 [Mizuhopecten yessoensis]|uniref:Uncharacterized protein n=1 Tax=Mizuhopecten yessoensis TaxID=6573 RepID=A0A210PDV4_MIZYE|nr:hypothetical protein KP79_PYT11432 [Mizuhopecten yessoensis]